MLRCRNSLHAAVWLKSDDLLVRSAVTKEPFVGSITSPMVTAVTIRCPAVVAILIAVAGATASSMTIPQALEMPLAE